MFPALLVFWELMSPTVKLEVGPPFDSFIHNCTFFACDCVFVHRILHVEGLGSFICGSCGDRAAMYTFHSLVVLALALHTSKEEDCI